MNREFAITRFNAPSSSRTFERMRFAMKNATSSGSMHVRRLRLADENRHAGLELRRLDGNRETPSEAGFQALFETRYFFRITIAGDDHLLLAFEQRIERVEKFFLRAILVREELDVVDEQRIERAIRRLELVHLVVLKRDDHVTHESLGVDVRDARFRIARLDGVTHRLHQVRLAETDAAVDEQRVVGAAGILRDLNRRGLGELVALAFDEAIESEIRVEPDADDDAFAALGPRRAVGSGSRTCTGSGPREPTSTVTMGASPSTKRRTISPRRDNKWALTQSTAKRLGASSFSAPLLSTACSGRTQMLKCSPGSSSSRARMQRAQSELPSTCVVSRVAAVTGGLSAWGVGRKKGCEV